VTILWRTFQIDWLWKVSNLSCTGFSDVLSSRQGFRVRPKGQSFNRPGLIRAAQLNGRKNNEFAEHRGTFQTSNHVSEIMVCECREVTTPTEDGGSQCISCCKGHAASGIAALEGPVHDKSA